MTTPSVDHVQNGQDDLMETFLNGVAANHDYMANVLYTFEIHKLEAVHQNRDKPRVFLKTLDELGIILDCELNPASDVQVPLPRETYTDTEIMRFLLRLEVDGELCDRLRHAFMMGGIEYGLYKRPRSLTSKPFFHKEFDDDGIPHSFGLNWKCVRIDADHYEFREIEAGRKHPQRRKRRRRRPTVN